MNTNAVHSFFTDIYFTSSFQTLTCWLSDASPWNRYIALELKLHEIRLWPHWWACPRKKNHSRARTIMRCWTWPWLCSMPTMDIAQRCESSIWSQLFQIIPTFTQGLSLTPRLAVCTLTCKTSRYSYSFLFTYTMHVFMTKCFWCVERSRAQQAWHTTQKNHFLFYLHESE